MAATTHIGPMTVQAGKGNYDGYIDPSSGKPLGRGIMWFDNGDYYEGAWSNGCYHGNGTLKTSAYEYDGVFSLGKITGQGKMSYKGDGVYEGWLVDRKKQGMGTMSWPNGIRYTGQWDSDRINGDGKVTWPNGDWWEATWDGSPQEIWDATTQKGKGRTRWHSDGDIYEGPTKGEYRHGFGTLTTPERKYEGNFKDSNRDGKFKVTDLATGKITHRNYKKDKWIDD